MSVEFSKDISSALAEVALSLADDELILAHRDSEWTGHAPILEEDIAFSNIAQDELGHASLWYELSCLHSGEDPDSLVFFRGAHQYRNVQLVELPIGDFAFSMARQYLFDAYELVNLARLAESSYKPLAQVANKIRTEELYHYRHTSIWMKRLGLGTGESNRRTQLAIESLWPFTGQLFATSDENRILSNAGLFPDPTTLRQPWEGLVIPFLRDSGLAIPDVKSLEDSRREHTEHLPDLLLEMQEVARIDPAAQW